MEIDRKLRKYAGVMAEQRYAIRTKAGGRKGAAFGVSVKLDRTSSTPVSDQLRHIFVENAVRIYHRTRRACMPPPASRHTPTS